MESQRVVGTRRRRRGCAGCNAGKSRIRRVEVKIRSAGVVHGVRHDGTVEIRPAVKDHGGVGSVYNGAHAGTALKGQRSGSRIDDLEVLRYPRRIYKRRVGVHAEWGTRAPGARKINRNCFIGRTGRYRPKAAERNAVERVIARRSQGNCAM